MDSYSLLPKLAQLGPRVGNNETKTVQLIRDELAIHKISFVEQPFTIDVPICTNAELIIDGERIPCLGSSIVSGDIPSGDYLISHFGYTGEDTAYNIAYSPMTDSISVVDHFKVPSVTISRESIIKVIMAKTVKGSVTVEKHLTKTANILVGNIKNPTNLVFAHFDSIIGPGAVDNAGSVAVMFDIIINNPSLREKTLFIFSGNEEMCYDDYKLSGYGFRVFETDYSNLLMEAKKIIVLDGVGMGMANWSQSGLDWVLQLKMLDQIRSKVTWLQNDQTPILKVFHTSDDMLENIETQYLQSAEQLLVEALT